MDILTDDPQHTDNTAKPSRASPDPKFDIKKSVAIEAYIRAKGLDPAPVVPFDLKIIDAVKKWTTRKNTRIGFYIAGKTRKIRVRVIKSETGEQLIDMSLTRFMDSSPTET
jgi:hypothetical protein